MRIEHLLLNQKVKNKGIILPFFNYRKVKYFILIFLLGFILFFIQNSCSENGKINNKINEFIKDAKLVEEIDNNKIYNVSRETSEKPSIHNGYIGTPGDILITKDSPFKIPIIKPIIDFTFGGHAAIITSSIKNEDGTYGETGDMMIESVGLDEKDGVILSNNTWGREKERINILGLRIKGYNQDDYNEILNKAYNLIGRPYNYTFLFNKKNRYYCTDLISRLYNLKNVKLNDGFITSTNDIILSDDVYIFYYQYIDSSGITHIYY